MRVISVMNLKGGVGKTTTIVNMAAILARDYDKKVVVIDADPQANATDFFKLRGRNGLYAWYSDSEQDPADPLDYIHHTDIPGVSIIPAEIDLVNIDIDDSYGNGSITFIADLCSALSDGTDADFVLIDCPPCFTTTSCAALYASEDVIIPVKPDGFVASGLMELDRQLAALRRLNQSINVAGALITMWHNSEAVNAGTMALRDQIDVPVFRTMIRRSDKVDESTFARQTLDEWSPYSAAGRDYRAFVAEYLGV